MDVVRQFNSTINPNFAGNFRDKKGQFSGLLNCPDGRRNTPALHSGEPLLSVSHAGSGNIVVKKTGFVNRKFPGGTVVTPGSFSHRIVQISV